jgi:hypothetical protein
LERILPFGLLSTAAQSAICHLESKYEKPFAPPVPTKRAEVTPSLSSVEQPEMRKWAVILLLLPFFHFNQTTVGSLDFLQYVLCMGISFALCALMRQIRSFDVLTKVQ